MGKQFGYKKYMKKDVQSNNSSLFKIFVISFFGMLLVFTFLIKSFSPTVDTSIGDYKSEEQLDENYNDKVVNVDNRLESIQNEDQGKNFSELMRVAETSSNNSSVEGNNKIINDSVADSQATPANSNDSQSQPIVSVTQPEPIYKVFVGSYTSAEQAKVAKDIILESGSSLNPIVKCIGSNNYTLQVGIFKNKKSAETLLYTVQQSNLPGRIVQDY